MMEKKDIEFLLNNAVEMRNEAEDVDKFYLDGFINALVQVLRKRRYNKR